MAHFFPNKRPSDVINASRTGNNFHPTEKPVSLMKTICDWSSGVMCDPFMGSGTTGVACIEMGRPFIGIEINETYFEIAYNRIKNAMPIESII